jgi:hypothetical protein
MFGVGIGVGIGRQRFASGIFSAYAARVAADGGVTEAGACVDAVSALLQTASLLLVPSGYKSGKVYSQIPTDGNGDLTFTRASSATRVNSDGEIESVATGVPRLDYSQGSCPALLLEPQRTNLVFPSETASTQTITVTAVAHTLSFFGTGTVVLSGVAIATLTGTGANNRVTLTFTPTAGSLTLTVTGTVTLCQLEAGAYATTYIPTTTAAVTRIADAAIKTGISSLIGQTEGTLFFEFTGTPQSNVYYSLSPGGLTNAILVGLNPGGVINARIFAPFPTVPINVGSFAYIAGQRYKVAFAYDSTQCAIAVNGALQTTSGFAGFAAGTLSRLGIDSSGSGQGVLLGDHHQVAIFTTRLSNSELTTLTTL